MSDHKIAVITGANGYLGIAIAQRLIDKLPESTRLTIVVTSRTLPGVKEAVNKIKSYSDKHPRSGLVEYDYLVFDQLSMVSMLSAAEDLTHRFKHIDYLFLNSSFGAFKGIDYMQAAKDFVRFPLVAFTAGTFKVQYKGKKSGDGMGASFQANVLSPYYLVNRISPLLENGGRVIWISTSISLPDYFDPQDIELIESEKPYETSKYETELLQRAIFKKQLDQHKIQHWMIQPGVFKSTTFVPTLNIFSYIGMFIMFYICRFFGSPYHCIWPELGAVAPVWAALDADPATDDMSIKHGSSCTRFGREKMIETRMELDSRWVDILYNYVEEKRLYWQEKLKDQVVKRHLY